MAKLSPSIDLSSGRKPENNRADRKVDAPRHKATVLSLDPGGTTGWSVMSVHAESLFDPEVPIVENIEFWCHGQIDCGSKTGNRGTSGVGDITDGVSTSGEAAGINEIISLIRAWPGAAVVIEDFVIRQGNASRDFLSPVRVTAGVNQYLYNQRRPAYFQQPSLAKTSATDDRLKLWGIYSSSGGENHARDADRHSITFLTRVKQGSNFPTKAKKAGLFLPDVFPHIYGPKGAYASEFA